VFLAPFRLEFINRKDAKNAKDLIHSPLYFFHDTLLKQADANVRLISVLVNLDIPGVYNLLVNHQAAPKLGIQQSQATMR
jgi:hypothetical protein